MADHTPPHPDEPGTPPTGDQSGLPPLSAPQWLRAAADGETTGLTPPPGLPTDADARIQFDRSLRSLCSRTLEQTTCPDAVRRAVIAAMAADSGAAAAAADAHGVIRSPLGDTTSRSFWSGVARFGALAAVLALGATVVYKGVSAGAPSHALPAQQASLLASFVEQRHHTAAPADDKELPRQFSAHSVQDSITLCAAQLDAVPTTVAKAIAELEAAGITFVGVTPCDVPGQGPAVHLMFRATNEFSPARVSLFIQRDTQDLNIKASACYLAGCPKHGRLIAWRDNGFVNYLYACTPESLGAARKALRLPASERPL